MLLTFMRTVYTDHLLRFSLVAIRMVSSVTLSGVSHPFRCTAERIVRGQMDAVPQCGVWGIVNRHYNLMVPRKGPSEPTKDKLATEIDVGISQVLYFISQLSGITKCSTATVSRRYLPRFLAHCPIQ